MRRESHRHEKSRNDGRERHERSAEVMQRTRKGRQENEKGTEMEMMSKWMGKEGCYEERERAE